MIKEWWKEQNVGPKKSASALDAFTDWIKNSPIVKGRLSVLDSYSGATSTKNHTEIFEVQMSLYIDFEAIKCKALASTFQGKALAWLLAHNQGSITSYDMLRNNFLNSFAGAGETTRPKEDLIRIRQQPNESTASYITRFQKMTEQIIDLERTDIELCFMGGLSCQALKTDFSLRKPKGVEEMYERAMAVAGSEEPYIPEVARKPVKERIEFKAEPELSSRPGRNRCRRTDAFNEKFTPSQPRES